MIPGSACLMRCSVVYKGRACSTLDEGTYLVIFKQDQSLSIHGRNKILPLNYIGSGCKASVDGSVVTFTRKSESITIVINSIITSISLDLSELEPVKHNTERELVDQIAHNLTILTGCTATPEREKKTEHGPIDLYVYDNGIHHIIEAKRRTASIKDVTQVIRYGETFCGDKTLYIAAPKISKNALKYATERNVKFLEVHHSSRI